MRWPCPLARLRSAGNKVEPVGYKGLTHDAEARGAMLGTSDAFLRQTMGL